MKTLRDMLAYYNNADVAPFLEAISKQRNFYAEKGLDMFKQGISVPGLSLRLLFKYINKTKHFFQLFGSKNKDLHKAVKNGVVGGPSIVFSRYQEAGLTRLRSVDWQGVANSKAKLCQGVAGYDANALYLWCISQDMPTGVFMRRKAPKFEVDWGKQYSRVALDWLQYEAENRNVKIHTWIDEGGEMRLGPQACHVDGYSQELNTIFEFNGCYFHGHTCKLNKGKCKNIL